jgi:hypothetical protein
LRRDAGKTQPVLDLRPRAPVRLHFRRRQIVDIEFAELTAQRLGTAVQIGDIGEPDAVTVYQGSVSKRDRH